MPRYRALYRSHGDGSFETSQFNALGSNVIFEIGVMVFHPENIDIGNNVYLGHQAILKAYHQNKLVIGDDSWIGQQCFIHSAGGVTIGRSVGVGPGVKILSSYHRDEGTEVPILFSEMVFKPVTIEDECDIGAGAVILAGVTIGRGSQIGAGAVVSRSIPAFSVAAGVPARVLRSRRK